MLSTQLSHDTIQEKVISDGTLVEQALAGDQRAFELLVQRYQRPLMSYICTFLRNEEQVDDILQHVFWRLSVCLPILSTERTLRAWLFQVARYRCLDELRRKRRRPEVLFSTLARQYSEEEKFSPIEIIPDPEPSPEERVELIDLQCALQQAILFLPPQQRSIVYLHSFKQLNFVEIGQRLNMRENTVKAYFYRALPRLRKTLVSDQPVLLSDSYSA